jgi:anti-anti-sigma factor
MRGCASSRSLVVHDAGDGVLRLDGEIDAATAPQLHRRVGDEPTVRVLDMRHVTFIDASSLGVLLLANRDRNVADRVTLQAPTAAVCRVLEPARLTALFCIETRPVGPTGTSAHTIGPPVGRRWPSRVAPIRNRRPPSRRAHRVPNGVTAARFRRSVSVGRAGSTLPGPGLTSPGCSARRRSSGRDAIIAEIGETVSGVGGRRTHLRPAPRSHPPLHYGQDGSPPRSPRRRSTLGEACRGVAEGVSPPRAVRVGHGRTLRGRCSHLTRGKAPPAFSTGEIRNLLANLGRAEQRLKNVKGQRSSSRWRRLCCSDAPATCSKGVRSRFCARSSPTECSPAGAERITAVVHVDGIVRIQTIESADESLVHLCIVAFECRTGMPVVVNAPLHFAGRLMADDPPDAFDCFGSVRGRPARPRVLRGPPGRRLRPGGGSVASCGGRGMTGSTSTVDAVVPTIGRPSLAVVLRALADPRQPVVGRVVVVDDRSHADGPLHDDINEIGNRLDVEVIRDPVRGPAAARTVGWLRASTGWAAFLDDDDVPPPDWATGLAADLAAMEADPAVVGVQGRIVLPLPTQRRPTDWERSVAGLEHVRSAAADLVAVGRRLAGEWRARRVGRGHRPAEAVLFDRDGTLIVDVPYNGDPDRVAPVAGAAAALDELRHDDVDVVVLQRPEDEAFATAWLGRRPGRDVAAVWLEHNAPQGRLADMRHPAADQDDLIVVHVTYTNALFWDCRRTETRVIDALEADVGRITGWGDHLALSSWAAGGCWPVATGGVQPRPSTSRRSSLGATATSANRSALSPSTPRRAP